MNKIIEMIEFIFGPNWRTSLWGSICVTCATISFYPKSVEFLPDQIESFVVGLCGLVATVTGYATVLNMKDKNVTGGNIPSTQEAKKRLTNVKTDT